MLVLSDSGGAAHDIRAYCDSPKDNKKLPDASSGRSQRYIEAAAELLPHIEWFGLHRRSNGHVRSETSGTEPLKMLSFFSAEKEQDFDSAVQQALPK